MKQYSFLIENNQTITRTIKSAHQFGYKYWKSGRRDEDNKNGLTHVYRTKKDEEGNSKIKRIMKKLPKDKKDKKKESDK